MVCTGCSWPFHKHCVVLQECFVTEAFHRHPPENARQICRLSLKVTLNQLQLRQHHTRSERERSAWKIGTADAAITDTMGSAISLSIISARLVDTEDQCHIFAYEPLVAVMTQCATDVFLHVSLILYSVISVWLF